MRLIILFFLIWCSTGIGYGQYKFEGQISKGLENKTVYLSLIDDYRKLSRISIEQIIKKTQTDTLGLFKFEDNNLPDENRIYRIHIEDCAEGIDNADHFFGKCKNSKSLLFIANNNDTLSFPKGFDGEVLCEITSTNRKSTAFLEIDALKEEMAFDFYDFRSEANRKLNLKKWFNVLHDFGAALNEPLAELYIYDFLSDKRNETYTYYLYDIINNPDYYIELGQKLKAKYPNTLFTELYNTEITTDQRSAVQKTHTDSNWKWVLGGLLLLSLVLNFYLILKRKTAQKNKRTNAFEKLTLQEQKIVAEILKDKTNKEIASGLFISLSTVKTHINNLYKKLNVTSRDEIKALF